MSHRPSVRPSAQDTGEDFTGIHHGQTGLCVGWPSGGSCYRSTGRTERYWGFAISSTSNRNGADTTAPTEAHGVRDFAETTSVSSTDPNSNTADAAAPGWVCGSVGLVAAPASGDAGYGLAGVTGSCS